MKNLRLQLIAAAAAFLIPQMIGVGMATVALNGGRTWGPATFSIILGLFLMIGPIWAIMTIKQFEDWTFDIVNRTRKRLSQFKYFYN